jgi:AbrB family looped-hinge helix DNA binding protein
MKVTSKGQVTIPQSIRRYLGISAQSEVNFRVEDNRVVLDVQQKDNHKEPSRYRKMLGIKKGGLSTDEWMELTRGEE